MRAQLENFWGDLIGLIPETLLFLLILAVGFIIAWVLAKATDAGLNRLRVNRLFQRNVEKATSQSLAWNVVGVLSKVVYWLVVLFTLNFAFGVFGDNAFTDLFQSIIDFLPKAVVAVILVVIAAVGAGIVRDVISGALAGLNYGRALANIAAGFILAIGILAGLTQVGIAVAITLPILYFFLATIGVILGIGVGGGLIQPMRSRLDRWLGNAEAEISDAKDVVSVPEPPAPPKIRQRKV